MMTPERMKSTVEPWICSTTPDTERFRGEREARTEIHTERQRHGRRARERERERDWAQVVGPAEKHTESVCV